MCLVHTLPFMLVSPSSGLCPVRARLCPRGQSEAAGGMLTESRLSTFKTELRSMGVVNLEQRGL